MLHPQEILAMAEEAEFDEGANCQKVEIVWVGDVTYQMRVTYAADDDYEGFLLTYEDPEE